MSSLNAARDFFKEGLMKRICLYVALFCLATGTLFSAKPESRLSSWRPQREVAVTFDDLPAMPGNARLLEINRKLVESITRHKVPAVGFVNEGRLFVPGETESRIALLRLWLDAGLELGNHTFSHIQIDNNSLAAYQEDVIRGEKVTKKLLQEKGMKLRFFRHTQLRTGPTPEYERDLNHFLASRGYKVAPVTLDSQEWVYAAAYAAARRHNDLQNVNRIAQEYLKFMEEIFAFFEQLSTDLLGYEVKQTLLLHANELNADHFDALAEMMKRRGYRFISLEEALKDPAYQLPTAHTRQGLSWLHRWMMARGLKTRSEPREPEWLNRLIESYTRR
jgi:peptidoglycan/xylan/chitin deacetylase (PgdA/CDA1 family)